MKESSWPLTDSVSYFSAFALQRTEGSLTVRGSKGEVQVVFSFAFSVIDRITLSQNRNITFDILSSVG